MCATPCRLGTALAAGLALCATPLLAQDEVEPAVEFIAPDEPKPETRIGEAGFESPAASIADAGWLVGQWAGEGIGGAEALESWLVPSGDTMVGTFVQETAEGGIQFTEHMYLMELEGSLVVKLKHFNPDLTGWEDKEGMVTFRLLAAEPCALYFNALTYRCVDPEAGSASGLIVAVRMKSDKPEPQELVFRFHRQQPEPARRSSCDDATTTIEMNRCYAGLVNTSGARHRAYIDAARERYKDDRDMLQALNEGEEAFVKYRLQECAAVRKSFEGGSIQNVMFLECLIERTDARTRTIWQNWLTYGDSTPPALPEPRPTQ